jgi:segregation and condensation protein B
MSTLASKIEAILYLKAQPLPISRIAEYAQTDRDAVEESLIELMANYADRDSALEVVETSEGYCLQLRESFHSLVQTLIPVDLGVGALRTLAAIALTGNMSQTDLIELRGSGAYDHVKELVELGFVRKKRQTEGRSYWLQVSDKFYQYFQVDKLPQPSKLPVAKNTPTNEDSSEAQMELEIDESIESVDDFTDEPEELSTEAIDQALDETEQSLQEKA